MAERLHEGAKIFRGIPVSAGVCRGKILVLDRLQHSIPDHTLTDAEIGPEVTRLEQALLHTRKQVHEVQRQIAESVGTGQASIFDAHLLVLEDPMLIEESVKAIREQKVCAEQAFQSVGERYAGV